MKYNHFDLMMLAQKKCMHENATAEIIPSV